MKPNTGYSLLGLRYHASQHIYSIKCIKNKIMTQKSQLRISKMQSEKAGE